MLLQPHRKTRSIIAQFVPELLRLHSLSNWVGTVPLNPPPSLTHALCIYFPTLPCILISHTYLHPPIPAQNLFGLRQWGSNKTC